MPVTGKFDAGTNFSIPDDAWRAFKRMPVPLLSSSPPQNTAMAILQEAGPMLVLYMPKAKEVVRVRQVGETTWSTTTEVVEFVGPTWLASTLNGEPVIRKFEQYEFQLVTP